VVAGELAELVEVFGARGVALVEFFAGEDAAFQVFERERCFPADYE
jgi:hypothetical protein